MIDRMCWEAESAILCLYICVGDILIRNVECGVYKWRKDRVKRN